MAVGVRTCREQKIWLPYAFHDICDQAVYGFEADYHTRACRNRGQSYHDYQRQHQQTHGHLAFNRWGRRAW